MSEKFEGELPPQVHGSSEKQKIWLITPKQFKQLPDGTELTDIYGKKVVKGQDEIDDDTRADENTGIDYLAVGFPQHAKPDGMRFGATYTIDTTPSGDRDDESEK
jgi:hypothetical protein